MCVVVCACGGMCDGVYMCGGVCTATCIWCGGVCVDKGVSYSRGVSTVGDREVGGTLQIPQEY